MALKDLFLESLEDNPKWESFLDILETSTTRNISLPISRLRSIRDLNKDSDIDVIRDTLRMLGVDVTDTFESFALMNMASILPQIPTFHEIEGTPKFHKFLELLLGTSVSIKPLYTSNYIDFYVEPLGALITEGGEWYLTSHIDLAVADQDQVFANAEITITSGDFKYFDSLNITKDLFTSMYLGKRLLASDPSDLKQSLLADRIQELYYKFCPIEDVLQKLIFSNELGLNFFVTGKVEIFNKEYLSLNNIDAVSADLTANKLVHAYVNMQAMAEVTLTSGKTVSMQAQILESKPNKVVVRGRNFQFEGVSVETDIEVKFRVYGKVFTTIFKVLPSGMPISPDFIYIKGRSTILDTDSTSYQVVAVLGGKHFTLPDTTNVVWTNVNPSNILNGNTVTPSYSHVTTEDVLTATYSSISGDIIKAEFNLTVKPSFKDLVPTKIDILINGILVEGACVISQGSEHSLSSTVTYSDGSVVQVTPKYTLHTRKAKVIDSSKLFCEPVSSDFVATLKAEFQDSDLVSKDIDVKFEYPKFEICKITIVAPSKLNEGDKVHLSCNAHWCKEEDLDAYVSGSKSLSEVEVYVSAASPVWYVGKTNGTDVSDVVGEFYDNGLFKAPEVSRTELAIVKASTKTVSGRSISTSTSISIIPEERRINYIDILVAKSVVKGSRVPMTIVANWNDGREKSLKLDSLSYNLAAEVTVEGKASSAIWIEDDILVFDGSISGIAEVKVNLQYTYDTVDGGQEVLRYVDTALVSLVKSVTRLESMSVSCPYSNFVSEGDEPTWSMQERTRMFINTQVRYEDGSTEGVNAKWSVESIQGDSADTVTIISSDFPLREMIPILTGSTAEELYVATLKDFYDIRSEVNFNDTTGRISYDLDGSVFQYLISDATDLNILFTNPTLSGYKEFSEIRTFDDLNKVKSRALIQTRHVLEDTVLKLTCNYYTQEESVYLNIVDAVDKPLNVINSSRLIGPREFYANYESVSYALAIDFDDGGSEYEVSSDWEIDIINKSEVMISSGIFDPVEVAGKTREELDLMVDNTTFVDIDEDGDVYCKFNIDMQIMLTTHYLERGLEFSKSMEVRAVRGNTKLLSAEIIGPVSVVDINDPNLTDSDSEPYIQYKGVVSKADTSGKTEVRGIWGIELSPGNKVDTDINGININETTGKLYLDEQINEINVVVTFEYEEDFDHVSEIVRARMPLKVMASKAIDSITIADVAGVVNDDSMLQLEATYTLLDGSVLDLEPGEGEWYLVEGPEGSSISESGVIVIPKLSADDYIIASVKLIKGNITLENTLVVNILARNALDRLEIAGHSKIRDSSTVTFEAVAFRQFNKGSTLNLTDPCSQECVTHLAIWSILGADGQPIDGAKMNPTTGELSVRTLVKDVTAIVSATYTEVGQLPVSSTIEVKLIGSYPRYGSAPYGVNTQDDVKLLEYTVENQLRGQFGLNVVRADGINNYGYFALRKSSGEAVIKSVDGRGDFGGWQGANWPASAFPRSESELAQIIADNGEAPVEVVMNYDNTSDTWLVYRTNLPNCGSTIFSFYTKAT